MNPDQVFASIEKLAEGVHDGPWQSHAQRLWGMAECWMRSHRSNGDDLLHTEASGDFGDRGEANARSFDDRAKTNFALAQLVQIQYALKRIHAGLYESCESCNNPILPERRAAVPDATRCKGCQEESARRAARR